MSHSYYATRKIGQNRGKPRLWLEGKILFDAGLTHGTRWNLSILGGVMTIVAHPEGKRKVSGKPDRPVIDISGSTLSPLGDVSEVFLLINDSGFIEVYPDDPFAEELKEAA